VILRDENFNEATEKLKVIKV